jgi:hypothetical protein
LRPPELEDEEVEEPEEDELELDDPEEPHAAARTDATSSTAINDSDLCVLLAEAEALSAELLSAEPLSTEPLIVESFQLWPE